MEYDYEIITIGIGPAGLASALYVSRNNVSTLTIGWEPGGSMGLASVIENYPGYESISGYELTEKMKAQATNFGGKIEFDLVSDIQKLEEGGFKVFTNNKKEFTCKAVIIATGGKHRKLGIPTEEEMHGKGLSYCATCDGPFFREKVVSILGSGDAAATGVLLIANLAKKVNWVIRKPNWEDLKCEPIYIERAKKLENVDIQFGKQITELIVENDMVVGGKFSEGSTIMSDGLFAEIGSDPQIELAQKLGCEIETGLIKINDDQMTTVDGIFAAGDVTTRFRNPRYRQISTSVGEGTAAALAAVSYVKSV